MTTGLTYMEVQARLEQLKLTQALLVLDRLAQETSQGQWSYVEFLAKLLGEELSARQERRLVAKQCQWWMKMSHFWRWRCHT